MTYFQNINSLSELKKQYRELVKNNHPDKGGDTAVMQAINNEFEKLYNVWKDRKETADTTGYANDYEGATAKQYTQHVYEEYGWTGSRRDRYYSRKELKEIFAKWLKETYKGCTFSIRLSDYNSIVINLLKADFNPFVGDLKNCYSLRRYDIYDDPELNARAKEMFGNIHSFCMSYNYDHSDLISDYHDVGFYLYLNIGSGKTPFKVELPKSRRASGSCAPEFKYKEGPAHQAIKKVLGKQFFGNITLYRGFHKGEHMVLGENYCYRDGDICFRGLQYSGYTTQAKKIEKLLSAGIITESLGTYIKFVGYTPEVEKALAEEDRAKEEAYKAWQEKQNGKAAAEQPAEQPVQAEHTEEQPVAEHNQQQPEQPEQTEPVNNSAAYGNTEKSLIFPRLTLISTDIYSLYEINGVPFISSCKIRNDRALKEGEIFNVYTDDEHKYGVEFDGESIETSILKALSFILKTECNEFGKALPKQFEGLKGVNIVNDLLLLLDVLQELLTEQPKAEEKQPTPEDIAKVLEVFPALLDAVCEILKADTHTEAHTETDTHQPHQEERTPCNNAIYNAVCFSVILTGEYTAARREIKQAIKRYRFTLPQLKYLVYILNTHPGINRERLKGAA